LPSPPRRHYVRLSAEPHPGLVRRVETIVRHAGLAVQNRASRGEPTVTHHGFLISPSDDATVAAVVQQLASLGRVGGVLLLGVVE
jgi:acetolactate synthase regulatory subunit